VNMYYLLTIIAPCSVPLFSLLMLC